MYVKKIVHFFLGVVRMGGANEFTGRPICFGKLRRVPDYGVLIDCLSASDAVVAPGVKL